MSLRKKIMVSLLFWCLVSLVCSPSSVQAADAIAIPSALNTRLVAVEVSATALSASMVTAEAKLVAQADTNVTTTATAYTPRFVGDALIGGAGAGTNAVWIAKGATTNDWVAIKP